MNTSEHARQVLAATISRSMADALRNHRTYVERLGDQAVKDGAVVGFVDITGDGESLVDIKFPITFTEKPIFTAGLELADNVWLQWGSFPTWSATVGAWDTRPTDGDPVYLGATVGIFVENAARCVLHYRFEARSYTSFTGNTTAASTL